MLAITNPWMTDESLDCIAEYLEACESSEMIADLRSIFPVEALKVASNRISGAQKKRIFKWVIELNQMEAA